MILQLRAGDPGPYTPSAKFAVIVPLYHIYGTVFFIFMTRMSFYPTNCGLTKIPDTIVKAFCHATAHILPRFELEIWLKSIQKYRITVRMPIPAVIRYYSPPLQLAHVVPPIALLLAKVNFLLSPCTPTQY